ncbi:MAG: G1 family glutamic endopeptidase [Candidatus Dormibacteria bacterium]
MGYLGANQTGAGLFGEFISVHRRSLIRGLTILAASAGVVFASAPASSSFIGVSSHPRIGSRVPDGSSSNLGWAASNWSGYAVTSSSNGAYTAVTGSWTITPVARSNRQTFSSSWIGIDGFNNSNLIQTGTEADYYNGAAHYYSWWEILPAAETVIPSLVVHPGDKMSADIHRLSSGQWSITLTDVSTKASYTTTQNYGGQLTSAEWIQEAPSVGGRIATLANYGSPLTIDPGTVNGGSPGLVPADGGVMVQHGAQVSTPSNPDADADGFNVSYGSHAPSPPGS